MFKFDDSHFCDFLLLILLRKIGHQSITLFDKNAFISESVKVFHTGLGKRLEGLVKLLVELLDIVDKSWQNL